jgi:hypothetical protein
MRYCPHCQEEAGGKKVADDDFIDYCYECDKIIEGQTISKSEAGNLLHAEISSIDHWNWLYKHFEKKS